MPCLPSHGRVNCTRCFVSPQAVAFDKTKRTSPEETWRITSNPLAWGSAEPEIVVLGFSKGHTQAGALATATHNEIAYKKWRTAVGKILAHVGVVSAPKDGRYREMVDGLIEDRSGRFHFGSLVRCTVERYDRNSRDWKSSGGGMLDKFMATGFGNEVATNCALEFLGELPATTRLVVMFGMGNKLNYVRATRKLLEKVRPGQWRTVNDVAYSDGQITFVHVEHFAAQGALIPNWLGENNHPRSDYGRKARDAVQAALLG
ncbi:hypothetical protein [Loktanella salsilacus]|uniref:hypothetical protein n=1 Tax=Loktanella salsilacus TaxID=195913 RepID=UPI0037362B8C